MLALALRSHTPPTKVGCLAMCRGKVERNKSEVDIVPVSQDYGRRMRGPFSAPGLPGFHRPIKLVATETAT